MNHWERKTLLVLAKAKSPMTAGEIAEADPTLPRADCSRAIYQLRRRGLVTRVGDTGNDADDARLPACYEVTADGIRECYGDEVTEEIRQILHTPTPENTVDSIAELLSTAEDTFVIEIASRDPQAATVIEDASLHANRLRAIASWRACEGDIRAWLINLAGLLDTHEESIEKATRQSRE